MLDYVVMPIIGNCWGEKKGLLVVYENKIVLCDKFFVILHWRFFIQLNRDEEQLILECI